MTKLCKFENGICIYCGDTTRVNSRGETCGGWTETDNSQTLTSALAEIERLRAALNRYSSDEVRLTKESTIAAQSAIISTLTTERDTLKQDAERFVVLAEAMIKDNPNLMESFAEHLKTQPETVAQIRAAIDAAKDSK